MKEFTDKITEEKKNDCYWNIYLYISYDTENNRYEFKIGKCEKNGYNIRYKGSDGTGHNLVLLAHEDPQVNGGNIDDPIKQLFKNDARFKTKKGTYETFYPINNASDKSSINPAIEEFKKFYTTKNTTFYKQTKEEEDTKNEILNSKEKAILAHFCPRYHKTGMILNLIHSSQMHLNIVMSYAQTVLKSYENDNENYGLNKEIKVVNADDLKDDTELLGYMNSYKKVAIVFFMTGTTDTILNRRISKLPKGKTNVNVYIDEADIGIQTSLSKDKIKLLKKTVKIKKLFVTSGTGLQKMQEVIKNFGCKSSYVTLTRSYIQDVLIPRGNKAVEINFIKYRNIGKFLDKLGSDYTLENWNDETLKNNRGNLEMLFKFFFCKKEFFDRLKLIAQAQNGFNLINNIAELKIFRDNHFNENAATILYAGNKNETHLYIENILTSLNVPCKIIDSSTTSNIDAEEMAKGFLKGYPNAVFIATNMANRSFSIPQIKNEIILMNDPSDDSYTQKCYRVATYSDVYPFFNKGFIWDFTLDKNDKNLYGIIGPEIERGLQKGFTVERTLNEIYKMNRVHFYFGALNNKDIFKEADVSELSNQLLLTTDYFESKLNEVIEKDTHLFIKDINNLNIKINNTKKGQGDREEKIKNIPLKDNNNNNNCDNENDEATIDNKQIFKFYTKLILGSKSFFYDCRADNLIVEDWESFGYNIDDINYVLNSLIKTFGKDLIKSKIDDSFIISKNNNKEEYNLRSVDYEDFFPEWKSKINSLNIEDKDSVIITIGIKSRSYIKNLIERNKNIYVIEFMEFKKDLSDNLKDRYFLGQKTKDWLESNFTNIIKNIMNENKDKRLIFLMNPPYGSLALKILSKVVEELPNSEIVSLQPIQEIQKNIINQNNLLISITNFTIIDSNKMNKLFNIGLWNDCAIIFIDKNKTNNYKKFEDTINYLIIKRKFFKFKKQNYLNFTQQNASKFSLKMYVGCNRDESHHYTVCSPSKEVAYDKNNTNHVKFLTFNTQKELDNCYDYMNSLFTKKVCKLTGLTIILDSYLHKYSNNDLYKYFNLTKKDIALFESIKI